MESKLHSVLQLLPTSLFKGDTLSIPHVALALFILWLTGFTTFVVYNLFFHPLSKYPGPRLAACTSIVYWYHFITGNSIPWIHAAHAHHGSVVRLAPDRLSYTSAQAWKDIFGHRSATHRTNPKDTRYMAGEINGHNSLVSEPSDERHGQTRRIFSHAFSDRALAQQEPLIQAYVSQLVALIRHRSNSSSSSAATALDATKLYNFATFDIMADLAFGDALGNLAQARYAPWVDNVFRCFKGMQITRALGEYPLAQLVWVFLLMPRAIQTAAELTVAQCAEFVRRRMSKEETGRPDIWGLVLRAEGRVEFSEGEMTAQSFLFMLAGTETTATLLSGLTWFLLMSPEKYERLVEEVRAVESEAELANDRNLRKLQYLDACLEEALRLYPPVPMGTMREVAKEGNTICGDWLPGRTRVTVAHYSAYRSAENWKDPDTFLPERWIPGEPGYEEYYAYDKRDSFQPFSYGPRNCLGKNLAYYEMRAMYSQVLWNFDLELCPDMETWIEQKTWFLWEKSPLMVRFTPR